MQPKYHRRTIPVRIRIITIKRGGNILVLSCFLISMLYFRLIFSPNSMKVSNGAGIEVVVHDLSIDPATDSLLIRGGSVHDVDYPSNILTGEMLTNNTIIIPHTTELYVQFISFNNTKNKNRGFTLTFAPYGRALWFCLVFAKYTD